MLYRTLVKPLLFTLPPEMAQSLAEFSLRASWFWRALAPIMDERSTKLRTELGELSFANPIGLAAGFDKDFRALASLDALGFGYVTAGTVTLESRSGNRKPRLFRDRPQEALVNSMGFPSRGLDRAVELLRGYDGSTPIVASISGTAVEDMVACHRAIEPHAVAVELNISSPNTAGLRSFHDPGALAELMSAVVDGSERPLFVKMPPYGEGSEPRSNSMELVRVCVDAGVLGFTVSNSHPVQDARLAVGSGGLSGRPLLSDTLRMINNMRVEIGDSLVINACGGIFGGDDVYRTLAAGANTAQIYTALIYRGPGMVGNSKRELLRHMKCLGISDVASLFQGLS